MKKTQSAISNVRKITESGLMLSIAFVLSMFPVMEMPFGGSITAGSMLPIILIAYRHGTSWGLFTGFVYSLLQLLTGLKNLSYATSAAAGIAIVLLDYLLAFTVLGLAGWFRKQKNQTVGLAGATLFVCVLRYVCHVISGCTVWAGVSIPTADGLWYSLSYNAAYMVAETLLTLIAVIYLSRVLDFRTESLRRLQNAPQPTAVSVCNAVALLLLAVAVAVDALVLFASIQNGSGFDITGIRFANWTLVLWMSVGSVVLAALLRVIARLISNKNSAEK